MDSTASGIRIEVSRGPNWLFLRLDPCELAAADSLADEVEAIVTKHFVYRVVLEFGPDFKSLSTEVIKQLDDLRQRLETHDGALRVCGLDCTCAQRLESHCNESKLRARLTSHSTVAAAVFGDNCADSKLPGGQPAGSAREEITQDIAYEALRVH